MEKRKRGRPRKRSEILYPGLDKAAHPKMRQDLLDQDYVDKLSDKEKAWLSKFNEEYAGGSFKKNPDDTYSDENIHKTQKERRECYTRNNVNRKCTLTRAAAQKLTSSAPETWKQVEREAVSKIAETEDAAIMSIDMKRLIRALAKKPE